MIQLMRSSQFAGAWKRLLVLIKRPFKSHKRTAAISGDGSWPWAAGLRSTIARRSAAIPAPMQPHRIAHLRPSIRLTGARAPDVASAPPDRHEVLYRAYRSRSFAASSMSLMAPPAASKAGVPTSQLLAVIASIIRCASACARASASKRRCTAA